MAVPYQVRYASSRCPRYDYSLPCPDHVRMVGHRPLDGSTASHPPCPCAIAASKRSSCARRASSQIAARTRTTAIVEDTPNDRVHGGQLSSRAAACSTTRRCQSTSQSSTRRLVRPAPRTASLGRHQRSAYAPDDSLAQKAKFGPDPTTEALDITGGVTKIGGRWQR